MRRSLVLTDESARHPFRASLPPQARSEAAGTPLTERWRLTATDIRGFATVYFASFAAILAFIL